MCTAASATPPTRCWKNASPRWKAAAAPLPWPAARRRCTWPSPRWPAPARTSWRVPRSTAAATTCCTTRSSASASPPASSNPATSTAGAPRSAPSTRLLFGETLGNPGLDVLDIPTVSAIAHDAGLPLLVDSTFTTPWLMKPIEHGADLVYHSATKFLCGHGTVVGGLLVDSGRFDWDESGRFPELTQPYEGFHGMVFSEESSVGALPAACAPRGPARLRRLHEPAHRLADPARHRDAAAAHGAARGQHAQGGGFPGRAPDGGRRRLPRTRRPPQPGAGASSCCRAAAARCSAST